MGRIHKVRLSCRVFFQVLVATVVLSGQSACAQDDTSPATNPNYENEKIVALAKQVIEQHEGSLADYHDGMQPGQIAKLQALCARLDSLETHEQAWVLKEINYQVRDSAAEVCSKVIQEHESGNVSDLEWIKTLTATADLLPDYMDEPFLSSLEAWEQKYPHQFSKKIPETMFRPSVISQKSTDFLQLAFKSNSLQIAGVAFNTLVRKDKEYRSSLETSANLNLASNNPQCRFYGFQLFSQLNPAWKGHQWQLKQLIDDPADIVSRAATGVWINNSLSSDNRRLLEALSADSDIEKLVALNEIDAQVMADWGSVDPVSKLVSSGSVDVRMAAIRTLSRTHPHIV